MGARPPASEKPLGFLGSLGLEVPYKCQLEVLPEDSGRIALDPGSSLRSYEQPAPCNLQKPEDRAGAS